MISRMKAATLLLVAATTANELEAKTATQTETLAQTEAKVEVEAATETATSAETTTMAQTEAKAETEQYYSKAPGAHDCYDCAGPVPYRNRPRGESATRYTYKPMAPHV